MSTITLHAAPHTGPRQFFTYQALAELRQQAGLLTVLAHRTAQLVDLVEADAGTAERPLQSWGTVTRSQMLHQCCVDAEEEILAAAEAARRTIGGRRADREASGRYLPGGTVRQMQRQVDLAFRARAVLSNLSLFYLCDGRITDGLALAQEAFTEAARCLTASGANLLVLTAAWTPCEAARRQASAIDGPVRQEIRRAKREVA